MNPAVTPDAPRLTNVAPQLLVDDLATAIAYYCERLGFHLDFCYESFYASVSRDACAIHLKCAPKAHVDRAHRQRNEHLDAYFAVFAVDRLHEEFVARGARISKQLEDRPWSCRDFHVEDPDGHILCFSESTL